MVVPANRTSRGASRHEWTGPPSPPCRHETKLVLVTAMRSGLSQTWARVIT